MQSYHFKLHHGMLAITISVIIAALFRRFWLGQ
jgi:hypothetical protein